MQCNIGEKDKKLRFWLAIAILLSAPLLHSWIPLVIGLALLYNSLTRKCYAFKILGINSLKDRVQKDNPPSPPVI